MLIVKQTRSPPPSASDEDQVTKKAKNGEMASSIQKSEDAQSKQS